ncbi:MAG: hypothetical protein QMD14_02810, partial [Candidatus Aenigmarchaeota archaeon]|nr:hypothetical protein [Candidatus Aenigmarchaeota archaeon]
VNKNSREYKGILCCLYDMITEECDGNVSYSVDAKNLLFRLPIEEEYKCELKGRKLELIYNSPYIKEEIENRKRFIQANISIDSTISKIFPLMISVKRTNQHFKELVHELMQKDAIDWLNTLSFQELERLLESEEEI